MSLNEKVLEAFSEICTEVLNKHVSQKKRKLTL